MQKRNLLGFNQIGSFNWIETSLIQSNPLIGPTIIFPNVHFLFYLLIFFFSFLGSGHTSCHKGQGTGTYLFKEKSQTSAQRPPWGSRKWLLWGGRGVI